MGDERSSIHILVDAIREMTSMGIELRGAQQATTKAVDEMRREVEEQNKHLTRIAAAEEARTKLAENAEKKALDTRQKLWTSGSAVARSQPFGILAMGLVLYLLLQLGVAEYFGWSKQAPTEVQAAHEP